MPFNRAAAALRSIETLGSLPILPAIEATPIACRAISWSRIDVRYGDILRISGSRCDFFISQRFFDDHFENCGFPDELWEARLYRIRELWLRIRISWIEQREYLMAKLSRVLKFSFFIPLSQLVKSWLLFTYSQWDSIDLRKSSNNPEAIFVRATSKHLFLLLILENLTD